jgi:RNA polymerase sigma-70 factor (ECF subfamily)
VLLGLARAGDADAFEELVRRYSKPIYTLLVRMLGNANLAEDAAQECFVRAWRSLASFRGEAKLSTWLYRIAVNEGNRILAHEARREHLPFEEALADIPDLGADTTARVELIEIRAELETLLAELPAQYRVAVVLRDVEGLSNEEAAAVLGLDLRTFKSRLHRGRMALRRRLEELSEAHQGLH